MDDNVYILARAISDITGTSLSVWAMGMKLFCYMYGNNGDGGLAALRHVTFKTMMVEIKTRPKFTKWPGRILSFTESIAQYS